MKDSGTTYVDMPDALVNVVRSCACSQLRSIASNSIVPILSLEIPNCPREETGGDQVEEAG